jgi:hypothetical protein
VRLVAGLLALVGIVAGLVAAVHARNVSTRTDREKRAVTSFINQFRVHLPPDRTPIPPDAIVIFSSVQEDLNGFADLSAADARKKGRDVAAMATKSADGLERLAVGRLVPEEFAADRAELTEAQFLIAHSYRLYESIGALIQAAAGNTPNQQQPLLDQAQNLVNQSGSLFDQGYAKIVRIANRLGIPIRTAFQPAPPGPQGNPTPTPAPTGTSSPSPSPSA